MASIEPYQTKTGRRYMVRYRKPDRRQAAKKGFTTKRDAQLFAATVEVDKSQGNYIDPSAGRATIGELGDAWLARQTHLKPSAYAVIESAWRIHVRPQWATTPIREIRRTTVADWTASLSQKRSATIVQRSYGILTGIVKDAEADGLIPVSRIDGIPMPKKVRRQKVYLTHAEVDRLAKACKYPTIVYLLAYTGIRWGEMAGLRVRNINFIRKRLSLEVSASLVANRIVEGTLKSHESRTVPVVDFLLPMLADACDGKGRDELVFSVDGRHMKHTNASHPDGWMTVACARAGLPRITPHGLRHTAASLAVQSGAHVKALQRMLGHASAAMTLDRYSDLFDSDLTAVTDALGAARDAELG